jgi:L-gulono-1,4-lactone dehydrogenase
VSWSNWTGDQVCDPARMAWPRDTDEVVKAVENASNEERTVRVVGAGHSFSDAVPTDGVLLSLGSMHRVLDFDESAATVRVQAGITLHDLNERLAEKDLALENLGDIDVQSAAGATQTGTHGTGGRLKNLSAGIVAMQLVTGDGSVIEVDESSDPDTWRAARVGIGALGVVTEMTLKTVPAFTLRGTDEGKPLEEVLESLDDLVDANEHFEFFTFPHSPLALTRTNNRVEDPPRPRSRAMAWTNDVLVTNYLFGVICRAGRRWPSRIPSLNRLVSRLAGSSVRVDRSYRIFSSPRLVRFTEMEYALPRAHGAEAVRAVRALVEKSGFHVPFPLEVRFVAKDDAFLSPASERDTCYVAVHMFEKMDYEPYFRAVESIMNELEGRPHWGKRHWQTAATLAPRYPQWSRFAQVRIKLDPSGLFANDYVRRVLDGN